MVSTLKYILISLILISNINILYSKNLDSLIKRLNTPKDRNDLCDTYNQVSLEYVKRNPDSSFYFSKKALAESNKNNYSKGVAKSYFNMGYYYKVTHRYDSSILYFNKSYTLFTSIKDTMERQKSLTSLGNVYNEMGNFSLAKLTFEKAVSISKLLKEKRYYALNLYNYANACNSLGDTKKAMQSYVTAKEIFQEIGDKRGNAYCLNAIGILYDNWSNYKQALEYLSEALRINQEIGDYNGIIDQNINLGNIYVKLKNTNKAIETFTEAYNVSFKADNPEKQADALMHLGLVNNDIKNYDKANQYLYKALDIVQKYGFADLEAYIRQGIGYSLVFQKKYTEAINQLQKSKSIADSLQMNDLKSGNYIFLALAYSGISNSNKAFENYKAYVNILDSTNNALNELRVKYETDKQSKEIQLLKKQSELDRANLLAKEAETSRQRIFIFSIIGGLVLVLIFFMLIYKQYRLKKIANVNLIRQKHIVEEQKKEIEDSILYAKRIQQAMLSLKDENGNDIIRHHLIFKPKSIVSGDFYWATKIDEWAIVAIADCTGHGVPGALMSMLGISFITEIVRKKEINTAGEVLNYLRKYVIEALKQSGKIEEQKDGMDIALIVINTNSLEMQYAGANNSIYIIKKIEDGLLFNEIKPDKMPIAIYEKMKDFTNNTLQLEKGDRIYLFSDGFPDQFGGPKGKKFNYANFKKIITNTYPLSIDEQGKAIENELTSWIAYNNKETDSSYEQTDDITLLIVEI